MAFSLDRLNITFPGDFFKNDEKKRPKPPGPFPAADRLRAKGRLFQLICRRTVIMVAVEYCASAIWRAWVVELASMVTWRHRALTQTWTSYLCMILFPFFVEGPSNEPRECSIPQTQLSVSDVICAQPLLLIVGEKDACDSGVPGLALRAAATREFFHLQRHSFSSRI